MEEHNETPDPKYQQGFNEGYVIAKHLPEFNVTTVKGLETSWRGVGFQHGQKQFILEKNMNRLPRWLRKDRSQKQKSDIHKNKDDIESRD